MEVCIGCGHSLASHFKDVTGVARCLHSTSGVSSSGVCGIPWTQDCDCKDFHSDRAVLIAERKNAEDSKRQESIDAIVASVRKKQVELETTKV